MALRCGRVRLDSFREGSPDIANTLAKVTDDAPVDAFTHNPDLFPRIPSRVTLTIAGHIHGGQIALPFIGRPFVLSQFGKRYSFGHVIDGSGSLYVHRVPARASCGCVLARFRGSRFSRRIY
jgi:predicted MPP superfamily phosphohydrolase